MATITNTKRNFLKHFCDTHSVTLSELSRATGTPRTTLRRRLLNPDQITLGELWKLEQHFGVSVSDLLAA